MAAVSSEHNFEVIEYYRKVAKDYDDKYSDEFWKAGLRQDHVALHKALPSRKV
jgi:hypothetical protein